MLFWIDIETTGLDPSRDHMLEIGAIVTDDDLNIVAAFPDTLIALPPQHHMDSFVRKMHTQSGLLEDLKLGDPDHRMFVEMRLCGFIEDVAPLEPKDRILSGSSVHFDRGFLKAHMPRLDAMFSHRHADASALREFARRWRPDVDESVLMPARAHRPTLDLLDSINLARFYRDKLFKETA